mgnify:CR=1 FL=1
MPGSILMEKFTDAAWKNSPTPQFWCNLYKLILFGIARIKEAKQDAKARIKVAVQEARAKKSVASEETKKYTSQEYITKKQDKNCHMSIDF